MPTKKRRVGFIPRSNVLDLINKLSTESNLSYSKIINILVEEALHKRGLFNIFSGEPTENKKENSLENINKENNENEKNEFTYNYKNSLLKNDHRNFEDTEEVYLDNEIYSKFLIFLQFQERMKNRNL